MVTFTPCQFWLHLSGFIGLMMDQANTRPDNTQITKMGTVSIIRWGEDWLAKTDFSDSAYLVIWFRRKMTFFFFWNKKTTSCFHMRLFFGLVIFVECRLSKCIVMKLLLDLICENAQFLIKVSYTIIHWMVDNFLIGLKCDCDTKCKLFPSALIL